MISSTTFDTFIKTALNPAQQEAVLSNAGSVLVVAGAGSGKTRVITARITNLIINHHVSPQAIVALTFTNKAANEMKERIAHFLGSSHTLPFVGTFHAYCVRLLKQYGHLLSLPSFSILDSDDQLKMISGILHRTTASTQITPRNALYQISHVKNQLINPGKTNLFSHPIMDQVYAAYEKEKKVSNCLDFDDLLLKIVVLFGSNSIFKREHQNRVLHVLVDEFQDTNLVQHELLKHMSLHEKKCAITSVCAVGDEDQSIYSWRGATIANMLNFNSDFNDTKIIKIEHNYRSVQPILTVANEVIKHNNNRNPKKLTSEKNGTDRIRIVGCMSEYQEGESIASCVKTAKAQPTNNSVAVLYRTHVQSRAIEEALIKNSIPYTIIGGIQFYERKEIKDLLAYLRLIINPFDRTSFFRIINTPGRGLGDAFDKIFYELWDTEPFLTFSLVAHKLIALGIVKGAKKDKLEAFAALFTSLDTTTLPSFALDTIIKKTNYLVHLKDFFEPQEAQERIDNVQELLDAIRYFESHGVNTLELFLHEVALMQEKINKQDDLAEKVLLMSLHAAKGLEFDTVIIAGLEEGIIPTSRAFSNDDAIEEERRLLYVGITRAKERLLITHTRYRYTYGKMVDQINSRFMDEIPSTVTRTHDLSSCNHLQLRTYFTDWFGGTSTQTPVMTFKVAPQPTTLRSPVQAPNPIRQSPHTSMPSKPSSLSDTLWRKNQPVKHPTYGLGMVEKTEVKNGDTYVTVKFKQGIKKIVARFLEQI